MYDLLQGRQGLRSGQTLPVRTAPTAKPGLQMVRKALISSL
jgi:hypothetical protein